MKEWLIKKDIEWSQNKLKKLKEIQNKMKKGKRIFFDKKHFDVYIYPTKGLIESKIKFHSQRIPKLQRKLKEVY